MSHLYFIALLLPPDLEGKILAIKNSFAENYQSRKALRLPGHITLQVPFKYDIENESFLLEKLSAFSQSQYSVRINFSGFGAFPPRVIYLKIDENKMLQQLHLELINFLQTHLQIPKETKPLVPHVTLANKDLDKENFRKAWAIFKNLEFDDSFSSQTFHLFKHDSKRWNILKEFNLGRKF